MKEYLFVYRAVPTAMAITTSPEEMQRRTKTWMDWIGGIAAKDHLVSNGNRLMPADAIFGRRFDSASSLTAVAIRLAANSLALAAA